MASKTAVNTLIAELKRDLDYDITDTDLDTLLLGQINKSIKRVKNLLKDYGISRDITANASFKTTDSVAYVDITKAAITGDQTSFTGQANDKIKVSIDGTDYDDIDISGDTTIAEVVAAINAATSGTQASENGGGYLVITSDTTGSSSVVTIADGASTGQTVVAELFSVTAERTQSAITDLDEIIALTERTNDRRILIWPYEDLITYQPDPTMSEASTPDIAARHADRIYFASTPSQAILIYLDYYKLIADVAAGGTMPFEDKYDPLITAMVRLNMVRYFDDKNATALADFKGEVELLKKELIINTAKNIGMNRQTHRRRRATPYFNPRQGDSDPTYA